MLFADNIMLVDETSESVIQKFELWKSTLENKGRLIEEQVILDYNNGIIIYKLNRNEII